MSLILFVLYCPMEGTVVGLMGKDSFPMNDSSSVFSGGLPVDLFNSSNPPFFRSLSSVKPTNPQNQPHPKYLLNPTTAYTPSTNLALLVARTNPHRAAGPSQQRWLLPSGEPGWVGRWWERAPGLRAAQLGWCPSSQRSGQLDLRRRRQC